MIPLCRYILQGGNQCQQAAINGEYYCRHHLVVRRTVAATNSVRPDPYRVEQPLPLVFPEDRAAQQLNVFMVMQAFNTGQIGPRSAKIFALLLRECAVNLKQGPLYETDRENAVRRVVVTPEGEEIAPAREVPEANEAASEMRSAQPEEATGDSADQQVSEENREAAPHTSNDSLCVPPSGEQAGAQGDFACSDPCYIENLTQRREQYRTFALNDLAAGRDPRAWEDFIPGKSKMRRPKAMAG